MFRKLLATSVLAAALATVAASPAGAEERICRGSLGAITVDNLRVPQGATCTLNGTRVEGTIKVERGATLRATAVRVIGNVQGENAGRRERHPGLADRRELPGRPGRQRPSLGSRLNGDILVDEDRRASASNATSSAATSRRSRTPAGCTSPATRSTATCSARRTGPPRPAAATSCTATRKTSAGGSEGAPPIPLAARRRTGRWRGARLGPASPRGVGVELGPRMSRWHCSIGEAL